MTVKEFRNATFDATSGNALIRVTNHKTCRKHGPAVLCLPQQKYRFLEVFVDNVRPHIGSVFLTWKGNTLESGAASKQINSTWKRSHVYIYMYVYTPYGLFCCVELGRQHLAFSMLSQSNRAVTLAIGSLKSLPSPFSKPLFVQRLLQEALYLSLSYCS